MRPLPPAPKVEVVSELPVQFGSKSPLYISVNQIDTTPAFTGDEDEGKAPYYILHV